MARGSRIGELSTLSRGSLGAFRGSAAVAAGISRKDLAAFVSAGIIVRVLPDTYRMTAVAPSAKQFLRAALLWGGDRAAAAVRSAGMHYELEGVIASIPEIAVPRTSRVRSPLVIVHRPERGAELMIRRYQGIRVTGVEATLLALADALDGESFEIACEDARRRRLTSVPSLRAYVDTFGGARAGVTTLRRVLDQLDPRHPSRSTLEVKTRRLLVTSGITDFRREFPLGWNGRTYHYDFAFPSTRTIVETNGRRWHDDPTDYEHDNEKWSVPGRHGYRIVLATWNKITKNPENFIAELAAARAA
jgi:very-short-patch-repair endonuclease